MVATVKSLKDNFQTQLSPEIEYKMKDIRYWNHCKIAEICTSGGKSNMIYWNYECDQILKQMRNKLKEI